MNQKQVYNALALLAALLLMGFSPNDQTEQFKAEYKKLTQHYMNLPGYQANLRYSIYEDFTTPSPAYSTEGIIKKNGENVYSAYFNFETLDNGQFNVLVDNTRRFISVTERDKKTQRLDSRGSLSATETLQLIDSIIPHLTDLKVRMENGDVKRYTLSFPNASYKAIDIVMDVKRLELQKIVVYCIKSVKLQTGSKPITPRAEIAFKSLNTNPSFGENDFSISRFIIWKEGRYVPVDAYKDYQVYYTKLKR